jgi:hypothetical protein
MRALPLDKANLEGNLRQSIDRERLEEMVDLAGGVEVLADIHADAGDEQCWAATTKTLDSAGQVLPVSRVTSVAFVGPDLEDLHITSHVYGMTAEQLVDGIPAWGDLRLPARSPREAIDASCRVTHSGSTGAIVNTTISGRIYLQRGLVRCP